MSRTGSSVRSGYCDRDGPAEHVREGDRQPVPERLDGVLDVLDVLAHGMVVVGMTARPRYQLDRSNRSPVTGVDVRGARARRTAPAVRRAHAGVSTTPVTSSSCGATPTASCQKSVNDEADEGDGHQVLPAQRHHLVDADARQRPAQPDDHVRRATRVLTTKTTIETAFQSPTRRPPGRSPSPRRRVDGLGADAGDLPAAEEERHGHRRHDPDVGPLDQEEDGEAEARVLRQVAGHQLRLGLGQVERRAVPLGQLAGERR